MLDACYQAKRIRRCSACPQADTNFLDVIQIMERQGFCCEDKRKIWQKRYQEKKNASDDKRMLMPAARERCFRAALVILIFRMTRSSEDFRYQ